MELYFDNRRDFLKKMLSFSVFTVACPHLLLGKGEPVINVLNENLSGYFVVKISQFPILKEMLKSVRLEVDCMPPGEKFPKVLVCKVEKKLYGTDYTAVNEICPHESGRIGDLHPVFQNYECDKHHTTYDPSGIRIEGPCNKNLTSYITHWDGGDDILIEIPGCMINSVELESDNLSYLNQNYPNPCSDFTSFEYGVENISDVKITVFDVLGREVLKPVDKHSVAGHFNLNLDVRGLTDGVYMCEMTVNGVKRMSRMITVKK